MQRHEPTEQERREESKLIEQQKRINARYTAKMFADVRNHPALTVAATESPALADEVFELMHKHAMIEARQDEDVSSGTVSSPPVAPKKKDGRPPRPEVRARWEIIYPAAKSFSVGPRYCRELDRAGLGTPWPGCPKSYAAAWNDKKWQQKIRVERNNVLKRFKPLLR